jgi:hypothetical protein
MIEENVRLGIYGPAFSFDAYANAEYFDPETGTILENIDGWDSGVKNIKTVQKGVGSGSYIVSTDIPEREVTVKMHFAQTNQPRLRAIVRNVKFSMLHDDEFDLILTQEAIDFSASQSESLRGRLKGYKWNPNGLHAVLELTFLCTDPEMNINASDPDNGSVYDKGI